MCLEPNEQVADDAYWRDLLQRWTEAEGPGHDIEEWRALLTDPRPGRGRMMRDDERELLAGLPDRVRVYRGAVRGVNEAGLSWAVARSEAVGWAYRNAELHEGPQQPTTGPFASVSLPAPGLADEPVVVIGSVARDDVIAFTMHRSEAEIIALPENVRVDAVEPAGPDTRDEVRRAIAASGEWHLTTESADEGGES